MSPMLLIASEVSCSRVEDDEVLRTETVSRGGTTSRGTGCLYHRETMTIISGFKWLRVGVHKKVSLRSESYWRKQKL